MQEREEGELIKEPIMQIMDSFKLKLECAEKLCYEQEETIIKLAKNIEEARSNKREKEYELSEMKFELLLSAMKKQEKVFKNKLSILNVKYEHYFQYAETIFDESFCHKHISENKIVREHLDEFTAFIIRFEVFCRELSLIISKAQNHIQVDNKQGRLSTQRGASKLMHCRSFLQTGLFIMSYQ